MKKASTFTLLRSINPVEQVPRQNQLRTLPAASTEEPITDTPLVPHGKRFSVSGNDLETDKRNGHDEQEEEESPTPIADLEAEGNGKHLGDDDDEKRAVTIIEKITEEILEKFKFLTVEESREILFYDRGVYAKGGEVLIEKTAENLFGYDLANRHLAEVNGHIMRKTVHKREELDADANIINLKNGLYNIETGEFKEHTPDYLSITQKPIVYSLLRVV